MNVAVVLIAAALAYLFIVGLALVWIRGASHLSMPKPPAREDLVWTLEHSTGNGQAGGLWCAAGTFETTIAKRTAPNASR